jgi:hypothetical protein
MRGTSFSPTALTIEIGEDVEFVLRSSHNAVSTFTVFPDPVSENITEAYTLNSSAFITIRMFNTVGVEVANILKESQGPGQYRNTYSLNRDLPPGLYFVRINSEFQSFTNKLFLK